MLGARVVTDLKVGAGFPTDHPLHVGAPGIYPVPEALEAIRAADVILSLDWVDLGGTLKSAFGSTVPPATIIHASLDHILHNGWHGPPGAATGRSPVRGRPHVFARELVAASARPWRSAWTKWKPNDRPARLRGGIVQRRAVGRSPATELKAAVGGVTYRSLICRSADSASWPFHHPPIF
jgi:thiamine pyrophosphate-dependent acetolactate synthase large subunit-like protein